MLCKTNEAKLYLAQWANKEIMYFFHRGISKMNLSKDKNYQKEGKSLNLTNGNFAVQLHIYIYIYIYVEIVNPEQPS